MTDKDRFINLYKSFGIDLAEWLVSDNGGSACILGGEHGDGCNKSSLFSGYNGFFSMVEFDANGKFLTQGFWE